MDNDSPDPKLTALYDGVVVDNKDPLRVGRVRVRVPGLIDEESAWALPFAMPGGGSAARGFFFPPPIDAEVTVFFKQGDADHPRYVVGPWGAPNGQSQIPTFALVDVESGEETTPEEAVLLPGIEVGPFQIIFDTREAKRKLTIRNKEAPQGGEEIIEIDADNNGITIGATAGLVLRAVGNIDINALNVRINGRLVKPSNEAI